MSNLLLRLLRERGIVTDGVIPFANAALSTKLIKSLPGNVVMEMPENTHPGPFWLVTERDAQRMKADGYKQYEKPDSTAQSKEVS